MYIEAKNKALERGWTFFSFLTGNPECFTEIILSNPIVNVIYFKKKKISFLGHKTRIFVFDDKNSDFCALLFLLFIKEEIFLVLK